MVAFRVRAAPVRFDRLILGAAERAREPRARDRADGQARRASGPSAHLTSIPPIPRSASECWQNYDVQPPGGSPNPERTKPEFCRWDAAFERHTYTEAWVTYLVRKLGDPEEHRNVLGRDPKRSVRTAPRPPDQRSSEADEPAPE